MRKPTPAGASSGTSPTTTSDLSFELRTEQYRSLPIPGFNAKLGECFVPVGELPAGLENFMKVNPRVPSRSKSDVLTGPVIAGIKHTLTDAPADMAIKNQGIYLLVDEAEHVKKPGGQGVLRIRLTDPERHGIVNGGHTFAAIRDVVENVEDAEAMSLEDAYVRLHILQGIDREKVPDIAEGLNRSKQVDDPSLDNLRGLFKDIQAVMKDHPGAEEIAYHQGDKGSIYVTEILAILELFNGQRFTQRIHPYRLFGRTKSALEFFETDLRATPSPIRLLLPHLPEILRLSDRIMHGTPEAAKKNGFEFGRLAISKGKRAGSDSHHNTPLPFLGKSMKHRVPRGWLFPMLAAFRANVRWDLQMGTFEWRMPLEDLVLGVLEEVVGVCVIAHRDDNMKPDIVGKRESTYRTCYDKVLLHLLQNKVAITD
jgi:hypothetical protein